MPYVAKQHVRWRVSIVLSKHRYYANRCSNPIPCVSWKEFSDEYPNHFSKDEAIMIADYYDDQKPTIDRVHIFEDEDEKV